jgi:hypothetical protein
VRVSLLFLSVAIISVTGDSCVNSGVRNIDQGEIHYSITYSGDSGFIPREFMPKHLIVCFKDNKILFDISAPFGNSGIMNLANPVNGIFDTYINFLGFKYFYPSGPDENYPGFEAMTGMEIHKTSGTSVICGFNCKSAEVTFPGSKTGNKKYRIWYTDEIKVRNPNAATPFNEIDGVLMKFFFVINQREMHFEAETVYRKDIPDKIFERKEKYVRISKKDIDEIIDKFVSM